MLVPEENVVVRCEPGAASAVDEYGYLTEKKIRIEVSRKFAHCSCHEFVWSLEFAKKNLNCSSIFQKIVLTIYLQQQRGFEEAEFFPPPAMGSNCNAEGYLADRRTFAI